jgi:AcrR family transcriptional regulator
MDAAEHLSATHGWDALTVRGIAEEAGTSTRAVYALFGSKQGLEEALHEVMFTRLRDLLRACERTDDPRRDVAVQALAYRQWAVERPERYALAMHRFIGQRSRPRSDDGLAVSREALDQLRQAVLRCGAAGLLLGDRDPEDVVTHLRAMAHGLASFENLGLLGPDPEAQWLAAVSAQLDGYLQPDVAAA